MQSASRGIIFLELVISVAILAILLYAISALVVVSYDLVGYSRTRISARHLANEKMEFIRNLPYGSVAVLGGIPAGNLPQLETVERNGLAYTVRTSVVYVDDPFDTLAPEDSLPTDYKRIRVDVSWGGAFSSESTITMVSDVAPKGVETALGGGTLSILVFNANAEPVLEANVRIQNTAVNPVIDLNLTTDSLGRVLLPGAPACFECYTVEVTKEGYSRDKTYSYAEVAHPDKPPVTVTEGGLSEVSLAIDRVSSINVRSTYGRSNNYAILANQFFQLVSAKTIGSDVEGDPVYKYDQLLQTGGSGLLAINDLEWGNYSLSVPADTWDLAGTNPLSPFMVAPNTAQEVLFASVAHTDNSLLLRTVDASGSALLAVNVGLTNPPFFDETLLSGELDVPDFGQVFFSDLTQGIYAIEATKSGYLNTNYQATVSGTINETVRLYLN